MTKATQTLTYLITVTTIWAVLLAGIVPLPTAISQIIPLLPLWSIVAFGAYLLGTLGWNIFTFRDKEGAYKELIGEIEEAKKELRSKGVTVD